MTFILLKIFYKQNIYDLSNSQLSVPMELLFITIIIQTILLWFILNFKMYSSMLEGLNGDGRKMGLNFNEEKTKMMRFKKEFTIVLDITRVLHSGLDNT